MKASYRVSLCGIIGALGIVLMLLTSVLPFGTFALPLFAGVMLICVVIELGSSWAFIVYAITCVISILFLADKEAALYYISFFGFYPILKNFIEKIKNTILQYIIKYVVFNICVVSAFYISVTVFSIPKESFNIFGFYVPWVFLIIGNITFLIYDYFVSKVVTVYIVKFHKILTNKTKL